jgi:multicomponent Na+:H+ antiporter subunit F
VSVWLTCAGALGVGLVVCALACLRPGRMRAVMALEVAGVVAAMALLILSVQFRRQPFADLALVLAVLSFAGALAFLRYLERH